MDLGKEALPTVIMTSNKMCVLCELGGEVAVEIVNALPDILGGGLNGLLTGCLVRLAAFKCANHLVCLPLLETTEKKA